MKYHTPRANGEPFADVNGRIYNISRYHDLHQKARVSPTELSDDDLGILESFGGTAEADAAFKARARARAPEAPTAPAPAAREPEPLGATMSLTQATAYVVKALRHEPDPTFDREKYAAEIRSRREQEQVVPGEYDAVAFIVAYRQYRERPADLTDADIRQLSIVDDKLGHKATAARVGFKKPVNGDVTEVLSRAPVSVLALFKYVGRISDNIHFSLNTVVRLARESRVRLDVLEKAVGVGHAHINNQIEITGMKARLAALERRGPGVAYRGVYKQGETYEPGDLVTWGGSCWHANAMTTAKPGETGTASRAWVLAVKAGRDGKDLR